MFDKKFSLIDIMILQPIFSFFVNQFINFIKKNHPKQ